MAAIHNPPAKSHAKTGAIIASRMRSSIIVLVFFVKGFAIAPRIYLDKKASSIERATIPPAIAHRIQVISEFRTSDIVLKKQPFLCSFAK
jgi:hypothetical protein